MEWILSAHRFLSFCAKKKCDIAGVFPLIIIRWVFDLNDDFTTDNHFIL